MTSPYGPKIFRLSPAPVVGWPPVGSYRKNLTSTTTSKQSPLSPSQIKEEKTGGEPEHAAEHMFIKVYMDGIPIGRKINLKAYDSYEKLSIALDELFGGLLAGKGNTCISIFPKFNLTKVPVFV